MNLKINVELTDNQVEVVRNHVLEMYDFGETVQDKIDTIEAIKNDYQYGMVSGGCLLISYSDINDFLQNELKLCIVDDVQGFAIYENLINEVVYNEFIEMDFVIATFSTGTIYTETIIIPNPYQLDEIEVIDEYIQDNKFEFCIYTPEQLQTDEITDDEIEELFSVNGGEYYVDGLLSIETC